MLGRMVLLALPLALGLEAPAKADYSAGSLADAARAAGLEVGAAVEASLSVERLDVARTEFTSVTLENSLKWQELSAAPGEYDFSAPDLAIAWAEEHGLRVRGHTLYWSRLNGPPTWLASELAEAADPAARLAELMGDHAATVVGRYEGRIPQWDVVNEPLQLLQAGFDAENIFYQVLGEEYLDIGFSVAHAADPQAKLFLNETVTELVAAKFDGLIAVVEGMLERGVPIHGIGLQGHFYNVPDADALQAQLERIQALGLLVEFTEVDIPIWIFDAEDDPVAAQARAFGDVFKACLAVSACTGVTTWGIDDGDTWLDSILTDRAPNQPLLFDEMLQPKSAYDAVVSELVAAVPEPSADVAAIAVIALLVGLRRREAHTRVCGETPWASGGS